MLLICTFIMQARCLGYLTTIHIQLVGTVLGCFIVDISSAMKKFILIVGLWISQMPISLFQIEAVSLDHTSLLRKLVQVRNSTGIVEFQVFQAFSLESEYS